MYQGIINKNIIILDKELREKDEFLLDLTIDENIVNLNFLEDSFSNNKYINNSFSNLQIDIENNKIINISNLINKWIKNKKDMLFETKDFDFVSIVMMTSDYFSEEKSLEFLILNYNIIPYIVLGLKKDKNDFEIYNEFCSKKLDFTIDIKNDMEENSYIFNGKLSSLFDTVGYRQNLREILKIEASKIFNINFKIVGKSIYEEEKLKEIEIKIELEKNNYIYGEIEFILKEVN